MTITALVPDGTDKYFFVVASDRSGRLLKVEGEERVDVLYYIEGSAPRLASTGSSVGGRLLSSRRILACEHSKEAVARKYQHFFFAVIFLIALVLGGQFLLRQINLKTPEVTYVTAQSVSHARGFAANFLVVYLLLWIAYLFYLAYLFII